MKKKFYKLGAWFSSASCRRRLCVVLPKQGLFSCMYYKIIFYDNFTSMQFYILPLLGIGRMLSSNTDRNRAFDFIF